MLQKDNKHKVLKVFFDDPLPEGGFQLRELSRKARLAPTSVKRYLQELEKEGLVLISKHRIFGFPVYCANRDSDYFLFLKRVDNILSLKESGLIDYIEDSCMPHAIVLFGSFSRGEDVKGSDIDLFVVGKETDLKLGVFEKRLNRDIHVLASDNFGNCSKEFMNNLVNGVVLGGYLKVFDEKGSHKGKRM